jgi:hypothetical protein
VKIFCEVENRYITERKLRKTRRAMKPPIINLAKDPKKWSEKSMRIGKFRVEFDHVV